MTRLKKILVACQYALLVLGFSALGYCAVVVTKAALYQTWANQQLLRDRVGGLSGPSQPLVTRFNSVLPPSSRMQPSTFREGSVVGRIEIPRIHLSAMIAEGTSRQVLEKAAGHVVDSALPGQAGNVALAGHRDTFFRRLGQLKVGDVIKLTTPGGQYLYRVRFTDVVSPDETWVLEPSSGQTLTLVTCYPFYFVGSAPKRFVVRARRLRCRRSECPLSVSTSRARRNYTPVFLRASLSSSRTQNFRLASLVQAAWTSQPLSLLTGRPVCESRQSCAWTTS
jgi:sortase A